MPMLLLLVSAALAAPPAEILAPADAAALVAAGATVLDVRGRTAFYAGHIPGAQRVDWSIGTTGQTFDSRMAEPEQAAAAFAAVGVDGARPVLVVGSWDLGEGEDARVAWALAWLGHSDVNVLRGGMQGWTGPKDLLPSDPKPATFTPDPREDLRADRDELRIGEFGVVLDVREPDEFGGARRLGDARGGHIPGARNLPWRAFLVRLPEVDNNTTVATYCTAGVRSSFAWLLLVNAGVEAANYDGSWWEWSRAEAR